VPRGESDGELSLSPRVDARRPTCARPRSAGQTLISRVEQSGFGKSLEVERGQRPGDAQRPGGFLATHRMVLVADPLIETASDGLVEEGDRGQVPVAGHR